MKINTSFGLCVFTLLSLGWSPMLYAKKSNQTLAEDYCKVYKQKFPKQKCIVDKRICPKGYRADKKFKGKGTNYSACVKGSKLKNLLKIGLRKGNKGSAETLNTKNCDQTEIQALNKAHNLVKKNWSKIKKEAQTPTRSQSKAKAVKTTAKKWKKLKKFISGQKTMQVECKSISWCKDRGILGRDDLKIRHVYVCVKSLLKDDYVAGIAEVADTLVHELAHTARFPMYKRKKHNCDGEWKKKCPQDDETYQIGYSAGYIVTQNLEKNTVKRSKSFKKYLNHRIQFKH